MKTIAIDIDGVLTIETEGHNYSKRTPNKAAIKLVNLLNEVCNVYLFTARYKVDEKVTKEWLNKHGVRYTKIVFDKPKYDYIIDDRAI